MMQNFAWDYCFISHLLTAWKKWKNNPQSLPLPHLTQKDEASSSSSLSSSTSLQHTNEQNDSQSQNNSPYFSQAHPRLYSLLMCLCCMHHFPLNSCNAKPVLQSFSLSEFIGRQQDVGEPLVKVCEELLARGYLPSGFFDSIDREKTTCANCKCSAVRDATVIVRTICCTFTNINSFTEALKYSYRDSEVNEYACNNCESGKKIVQRAQAEKETGDIRESNSNDRENDIHQFSTKYRQTKIMNAPDVAMFYLNWLKVDENNVISLVVKNEFKIEEDLNLDYVDSNGKTHSRMYSLFACLLHKGSQSSGHYVAAIRRSSQEVKQQLKLNLYTISFIFIFLPLIFFIVDCMRR
jgi:hypothetical protein